MSAPQRRLLPWATIAIILTGDERLTTDAFTTPLLSPVFRTIGAGCTPQYSTFLTTLQSTTPRLSDPYSTQTSPILNDDTAARKEYDQWRAKFNKGEFNAVKFEIFKKNYNAFALVNMISKRDAVEGRPVSKILDLNQYADMTMSEYEAAVMSLNGGGHVVSRRMDTSAVNGGDNLSSIERAKMASQETAKLVEKYGLDDPEDLEAVLDAMAGNAEMVGGKFNPKNIAREARIRTAYISWCSYYDKVPSEARFPNFSRNYLDMEEYARKSRVEMELNEYADCSEEELGYDDTPGYGADGVMIDGMFNVPQRVKGNEEQEQMWDIYCTWCKSFKKIPDENRFGVFMTNYRQLDQYARENNIELELAEYADCTEEEYIRRKREDQLSPNRQNKAFFDPHEDFMDKLRDAPGRRANHVSRNGSMPRSTLPPWREGARPGQHPIPQQQRRPSSPYIGTNDPINGSLSPQRYSNRRKAMTDAEARQKRLADAKAQADLQIAARKEATLREQKKAAEEFAQRQAQKAAELEQRQKEEEAKRAEGRRKAREEAEAKKKALDEARKKQEAEAKQKALELAAQRDQAQKELQQRREAQRKQREEEMARVQREAAERAKQRAEALEQRRLMEQAKKEEEEQEKARRRMELEERRQKDYEEKKRKAEERKEELKRMKEERELAEEMMKSDYLMKREEMKDGIRRKMESEVKGVGANVRVKPVREKQQDRGTRNDVNEIRRQDRRSSPTPRRNNLDDESLEDIESRVRRAYEEWCQKYGKRPEEERFTIFLSNYLQMEDMAQQNGSPLRLNQYADRTEQEYAAISNDEDDDQSFSMPRDRRGQQESSSPRTQQRRSLQQRPPQRSKNAEAYEEAERKAKQMEFEMKQREAQQEARARMASQRNSLRDEDDDGPRTSRRNNAAVRDRRSDEERDSPRSSQRSSKPKAIIPPPSRQQQSSTQTSKMKDLFQSKQNDATRAAKNAAAAAKSFTSKLKNPAKSKMQNFIQSKQNDAATTIRAAKNAAAAAKSFTLQAKKSREIALNMDFSSRERNKAAEDAKRNAAKAKEKMEEARVLMEEAMMVE